MAVRPTAAVSSFPALFLSSSPEREGGENPLQTPLGYLLFLGEGRLEGNRPAPRTVRRAIHQNPQP
jgi:hypothetical protein